MLLGLANSLRALTGSPITRAISEAHRMARRRLDAGGAAVSARRPACYRSGPTDYMLPADIDPLAVATAVAARLHRGHTSNRSKHAPQLIQTMPNGSAIVSKDRVVWIGDGDFGRGVRVLERLIADIRVRRMLAVETKRMVPYAH
jgi:hypothetical protein